MDVPGWRAIFFINLPVAALALAMGLRLPRDAPSARTRLDLRGALFDADVLARAFHVVMVAAATLAAAAAALALMIFGDGRRRPADASGS